MNPNLKYIELKTGYSHNGPAWIGLVKFSKSKQSIYFNGQTFKKSASGGSHYDIQTLEEYWISGVKKDMTDRHKYGTGEIYIEERVVKEYLKLIKKDNLPKHLSICNVIEELPIEETYKLENEKLNTEFFNSNSRFKKPNEMSYEELIYFIEYFEDEAIDGAFLKGRKSAKNRALELISEKNTRDKKTNY